MYNNNKFDSYYLSSSDCALHTLPHLIFIITCGKSVIILILKMINEAGGLSYLPKFRYLIKGELEFEFRSD